MDSGVLCSKEMVDLLMRIKRHAKSRHGISISMSDDNLMEKLISLAKLDDDLLQGMLQYFMALAGSDWSVRYRRFKESANSKPLVSSRQQSVRPAPPRGQKVRYYRDQPVYD